MDYAKVPYYILFLSLFILAQSLSMWGQFVTLPYKNLSMWEAYKIAIPFAWLDWIVMTFTVMIGDKYELVTPTQDTFLLIIIQFSLILLINRFYLKQKVNRSDIIAFFIILLGFFVSFFHFEQTNKTIFEFSFRTQVISYAQSASHDRKNWRHKYKCTPCRVQYANSYVLSIFRKPAKASVV